MSATRRTVKIDWRFQRIRLDYTTYRVRKLDRVPSLIFQNWDGTSISRTWTHFSRQTVRKSAGNMVTRATWSQRGVSHGDRDALSTPIRLCTRHLLTLSSIAFSGYKHPVPIHGHRLERLHTQRSISKCASLDYPHCSDAAFQYDISASL